MLIVAYVVCLCPVHFVGDNSAIQAELKSKLCVLRQMLGLPDMADIPGLSP